MTGYFVHRLWSITHRSSTPACTEQAEPYAPGMDLKCIKCGSKAEYLVNGSSFCSMHKGIH
ncbi:hypothetical protein GCM10025868_46850 [Angustibacter aerolatus]|nr:hypothetical protein GCM10025868_46850 [Angustibacter aerolatus]